MYASISFYCALLLTVISMFVLDSIPFALDGTYVNDLSQDTTTGQKVYGEFSGSGAEDSTVSIKFTKAGTYNMKAHCPSGSACVRSNHVVTVVS